MINKQENAMRMVEGLWIRFSCTNGDLGWWFAQNETKAGELVAKLFQQVGALNAGEKITIKRGMCDPDELVADNNDQKRNED